jgi:hypothetical protein
VLPLLPQFWHTLGIVADRIDPRVDLTAHGVRFAVRVQFLQNMLESPWQWCSSEQTAGGRLRQSYMLRECESCERQAMARTGVFRKTCKSLEDHDALHQGMPDKCQCRRSKAEGVTALIQDHWLRHVVRWSHTDLYQGGRLVRRDTVAQISPPSLSAMACRSTQPRFLTRVETPSGIRKTLSVPACWLSTGEGKAPSPVSVGWDRWGPWVVGWERKGAEKEEEEEEEKEWITLLDGEIRHGDTRVFQWHVDRWIHLSQIDRIRIARRLKDVSSLFLPACDWVRWGLHKDGAWVEFDDAELLDGPRVDVLWTSHDRKCASWWWFTIGDAVDRGPRWHGTSEDSSSGGNQSWMSYIRWSSVPITTSWRSMDDIERDLQPGIDRFSAWHHTKDWPRRRMGWEVGGESGGDDVTCARLRSVTDGIVSIAWRDADDADANREAGAEAGIISESDSESDVHEHCSCDDRNGSCRDHPGPVEVVHVQPEPPATNEWHVEAWMVVPKEEVKVKVRGKREPASVSPGMTEWINRITRHLLGSDRDWSPAVASTGGDADHQPRAIWEKMRQWSQDVRMYSALEREWNAIPSMDPVPRPRTLEQIWLITIMVRLFAWAWIQDVVLVHDSLPILIRIAVGICLVSVIGIGLVSSVPKSQCDVCRAGYNVCAGSNTESAISHSPSAADVTLGGWLERVRHLHDHERLRHSPLRGLICHAFLQIRCRVFDHHVKSQTLTKLWPGDNVPICLRSSIDKTRHASNPPRPWRCTTRIRDRQGDRDVLGMAVATACLVDCYRGQDVETGSSLFSFLTTREWSRGSFAEWSSDLLSGSERPGGCGCGGHEPAADSIWARLRSPATFSFVGPESGSGYVFQSWPIQYDHRGTMQWMRHLVRTAPGGGAGSEGKGGEPGRETVVETSKAGMTLAGRPTDRFTVSSGGSTEIAVATADRPASLAPAAGRVLKIAQSATGEPVVVELELLGDSKRLDPVSSSAAPETKIRSMPPPGTVEALSAITKGHRVAPTDQSHPLTVGVVHVHGPMSSFKPGFNRLRTLSIRPIRLNGIPTTPPYHETAATPPYRIAYLDEYAESKDPELDLCISCKTARANVVHVCAPQCRRRLCRACSDRVYSVYDACIVCHQRVKFAFELDPYVWAPTSDYTKHGSLPVAVSVVACADKGERVVYRLGAVVEDPRFDYSAAGSPRKPGCRDACLYAVEDVNDAIEYVDHFKPPAVVGRVPGLLPTDYAVAGELFQVQRDPLTGAEVPGSRRPVAGISYLVGFEPLPVGSSLERSSGSAAPVVSSMDRRPGHSAAAETSAASSLTPSLSSSSSSSPSPSVVLPVLPVRPSALAPAPAPAPLPAPAPAPAAAPSPARAPVVPMAPAATAPPSPLLPASATAPAPVARTTYPSLSSTPASLRDTGSGSVPAHAPAPAPAPVSAVLSPAFPRAYQPLTHANFWSDDTVPSEVAPLIRHAPPASSVPPTAPSPAPPRSAPAKQPHPPKKSLVDRLFGKPKNA